MTTANRPFDLILIGATGFTGRRAAAYLKAHAPADIRWGIAARNEDKLRTIAEELGIPDESCFIVDTLSKEDVDVVVGQCRMILTTVGPFSLYGEEVIRSCASQGTHYLDITGEVDFIKSMMDKYEDRAKQSGAVLIPFSGFDSVPADTAAYLLSKDLNTPDELRIKSFYKAVGGFNGGTIATMMNKFESGEYKKMGNPRIIMQGDGQDLCKPEGGQKFGYEPSISRWTAPFIMGAINSKVVYRSASIMRNSGTPYAGKIAYSEHSSLGKWYNPLSFVMISLMLISIKLLGPYRWFRKLVLRLAPNPGEGPSEETIEQGFFSLRGIARTNDGREKRIKISFQGDPGNKATVTFLCESAFCLLDDDFDQKQKAGFLTPITALGDRLINRLKNAGLMIEE